MIEQLNLFGERDELTMVCEMFRHRFEWWRKRWSENEWNPTFEKWVLDYFSSYAGGTAPAELEPYESYCCSPKGIELVIYRGADTKRVQVPKVKILRALGIRDDKKDALKEAAE